MIGSILLFQIISLVSIGYCIKQFWEDDINNRKKYSILCLDFAFLFFVLIAPYLVRSSLVFHGQKIFIYVLYGTMVTIGDLFVSLFSLSLGESEEYFLKIQTPMCKVHEKQFIWKDKLALKRKWVIFFISTSMLLFMDWVAVRSYANEVYLQKILSYISILYIQSPFEIISVAIIILFLLLDGGIKADIKIVFCFGIWEWCLIINNITFIFWKYILFVLGFVFYFVLCFSLYRNVIRSKISLIIGILVDVIIGFILLFHNEKFVVFNDYISKHMEMVIVVISVVFSVCVSIFFYYISKKNEIMIYLLNKDELKEGCINGIIGGKINGASIVAFYGFKWKSADFTSEHLADKIEKLTFSEEEYKQMMFEKFSEYIVETTDGWYEIAASYTKDDEGEFFCSGWQVWTWSQKKYSGDIEPDFKLFITSREDYEELSKTNSKFGGMYKRKIGNRCCAPIAFKVNF